MFQRYQRCPWEVQGEPEDEEDGWSHLNIAFFLAYNIVTDSPPRVRFFEKV